MGSEMCIRDRIIACRTNCVGSDQISTSDRHGDPEGNADLYAGVGV